ncbi:MAG: 4Fe-4S dicluster domain-containing protein [Bacteroidetes bacterium]|nr:MAG: 4Fe-4S dicluster domain-containing protein [Bacteroidota bacterium]
MSALDTKKSLSGNEPELPVQQGIGRRDFLRLAGFTFGVAAITGCQPAKVEKAIPFLIKPEEVTPGVASWYATTCGGCSAGCGVMAKNRDGRPIKLEGNPQHPVSEGGLCPVGQAHLLELYDSQRLMYPTRNGAQVEWDALDREISSRLQSIRNEGGKVRLLTGTITSPTLQSLIQKLLSGYSDAKHIQYEALSCSSIIDAHSLTHGVRVLPRYKFQEAEVIVSFDADFLGTWISPVEFTSAYRKGRILDGGKSKFLKHIQVEARMSLTGSNADMRLATSYHEIQLAIQQVAEEISTLAGVPSPVHTGRDEKFAALAKELWNARGKSLVVCGLNDLNSQLLVNYINEVLGNYGHTLDINLPSLQHQESDEAMQDLLAEMKEGAISALFVVGTNPVYSLPEGNEFASLMKKIPLTVAIATRMDETASAAEFVCPEPHALELWNDAEPVAGVFSITQPVIPAFGNTRPFVEDIAVWSGSKTTAYDAIRRYWEEHVFIHAKGGGGFQTFWDTSVSNGYAVIEKQNDKAFSFNYEALRRDFSLRRIESSALHLALYPTAAMLDGRHAHNAWLQELPDPVTKIAWENVVSLAPSLASELGVVQGDWVEISTEKFSVQIPAHIQPGQHPQTIAIPIGYGRKGTDRFTNIGPQWLEAKPTVPKGELVGKNVFGFATFTPGGMSVYRSGVKIRKIDGHSIIACTQEYHSLQMPEHLDTFHGEPREIAQRTTFAAYSKDAKAGSFKKIEMESLWPNDHTYAGHHWGMVIDLSACTGCSACVISCQAENNIPLVGKDEIARNRELTWIRIDRYYDEHEGKLDVVHQPMLCQHCGNAPCETVCPVLATVHSSEGLNQQVYNRCVGTRYCSNNCPYKVRRFNWFDYQHGDDMQKLVLNPDIAVRERGIMEKCSLCVQRIQEAKIAAKKENRNVKDGEIQPACAQSCPAKAIVFGDMNDGKSEVTAKMKDPRYFRVLEEVGTYPSVGYMTLVRNSSEEESANG